MKIDVLICTINERIADVPQMFLAPREDVTYVVSMQYTDDFYLEMIPDEILDRGDVQLVTLEGKGLCRNRNHALRAATGDVAVIADDNVRYCDEYFDNIRRVFEEHDEVDIAQFKNKLSYLETQNLYPPHSCTYPNVPRGLFVSSIEMVIRLSSVRGKVWFDERFGLGSPHFVCGEESIFVHDAVRAGLRVTYFPIYIVEHGIPGTGTKIFTDERVLMSNGAMLYYIHGWSSYLRVFKFAIVNALKGKCSFTKAFGSALKGIEYYKKVVRYENPVGG